jgi:hypothetical protein
MQRPAILEGESITRLVQGAVVGAVATMFIGFTWGGWTFESNAKALAVKETSAVLVSVLAPLCAEKFRTATDSANLMVEFKKVSSWQQDSYIQKGGWATFPGMPSPDIAVADACAKLLSST